MNTMDKKQNSESFQNEFSHVYESFFGRCKTVVSTDCTFWLTWGAGWREGAPIVVQKTPYRLYVGIEPLEENGRIERGTTTTFDTRTQTFLTVEDSLISWKDILPILTRLIKQKTGSESFVGMKIHLLSEQPFYTADAPEVAMGIICAVFVQFGFLNPIQLEAFTTSSGFELWNLSNPNTSLFREMHQAGMEITASTTGERACGDEAYASFVRSEMPFVYAVDLIDGLNHIIGCSLDELANVKGQFPFDVVSIDVGQGFLWSDPKYNFGTFLRKTIDELQIRMTKLFDFKNVGCHIPVFAQDHRDPDFYWKLFCQSTLLKFVHFFDSLISLYLRPLRHSAIADCLESLESMSMTNAPFEEMPSLNMQHIIRELKDLAEKNGVSLACLSVCYGKTEGNIMVFIEHRSLRNEILDAIEELKRSYDPNIALGFVSWRDGWGTGEGCRVDQSERDGIRSSFIGRSFQTVLFDEVGKRTVKISSRAETDAHAEDVVFDAIKNEIYVNGETVDSKKLPTKKATIDLFEHLISAPSHTVRNKDLKRSTYTSSRNDMQGKIVGPLVRLIDEKLGKNLSLKVEGEITTFFITWKPGGVSIAVISPTK